MGSDFFLRVSDTLQISNSLETPAYGGLITNLETSLNLEFSCDHIVYAWK